MINFTFDEMKAAQLALLEFHRDITKSMKDDRIPWNPEARRTMREMKTAAESAIKKISKETGIPAEFPEVDDTDTHKYLTKQS